MPWRLFYVLMLAFVALRSELDSDVDETNNISISIPTQLYLGVNARRSRYIHTTSARASLSKLLRVS